MLPLIYMEEQQKLLDGNYDKYMNKTLKELQKEYIQAQKDIEKEISDWLLKIDDIKASQPNFAFSELKQLQDLQQQINLILEELAKVEDALLTNTLKELYVSDYVDLHKLNEKYNLLNLNTPLPEFNQIPQLQALESYMTLPNVRQAVLEYAKTLPVEFVADAVNGKWFSSRIMERSEKLGYSIEKEIRQGIIRGNSSSKVAGKIYKEINKGVSKNMQTSFNSVKTLVRSEMNLAQNKTVIHNAMKLGYNGLKWSTYHDSTVCETCRKLDGTIYPTTDIKASDLMPHPNCRCILQPVLLDENGKEIKSSYVNLDELEEFNKQWEQDHSDRFITDENYNQRRSEEHKKQKKQIIKQSKPRL